MGKIYVFGHKNPDTDTITSSLVMANLMEKTGYKDVVACRLGNINKETEYALNYLNVKPPVLIEGLEDGSDVVLVDHNSYEESLSNLDELNILKVVDHHKVVLSTSYPLYYRAEPVGCTETVLYKMYHEYGVEIDKKIAGLMLSAIISDTLLLKSPTTTDEDRNAVKDLSKISGLDPEKYGLDMLKAGTDLSSFTIDEILNLDAKKTTLNTTKLIINQVNTASIPEVMKIKKNLEKGIEKIIKENNLDLYILLITDIINSNSQVIALGKEAGLVEKSFNVKLEDNTALLTGVVSRKKQCIPVLTENAK